MPAAAPVFSDPGPLYRCRIAALPADLSCVFMAGLSAARLFFSVPKIAIDQ